MPISFAGISLGLGLPEDHFERSEGGETTSESSFWVARVLHYPPLCQGDSHQPGLAEQAAKVSLSDLSSTSSWAPVMLLSLHCSRQQQAQDLKEITQSKIVGPPMRADYSLDFILPTPFCWNPSFLS